MADFVAASAVKSLVKPCTLAIASLTASESLTDAGTSVTALLAVAAAPSCADLAAVTASSSACCAFLTSVAVAVAELIASFKAAFASVTLLSSNKFAGTFVISDIAVFFTSAKSDWACLIASSRAFCASLIACVDPLSAAALAKASCNLSCKSCTVLTSCTFAGTTSLAASFTALPRVVVSADTVSVNFFVASAICVAVAVPESSNVCKSLAASTTAFSPETGAVLPKADLAVAVTSANLLSAACSADFNDAMALSISVLVAVSESIKFCKASVAFATAALSCQALLSLAVLTSCLA